MNETFCTDRGEAVGIGTINVLTTKKNGRVLPVFSFLVLKGNKEEASPFIVTCIDLRIDGYGRSEIAAIEDMNESIFSFLTENFNNPKCKDYAWENLEDLARIDARSTELWDIHKKIQYKFAEKNKTLYAMSLMAEKAKASKVKKNTREVVFISPYDARFVNVVFDEAAARVATKKNTSLSGAKLWEGAILGQTAILKSMKISPWLQQPIEGKKRCIQPLQL